MSQHIRVGNTYYHRGEEMNVLTTHHDQTNDIWYRGVKSRDNAGVISTTEWVRQQPYSDFLGAVEMRDYPDDWERLRTAVRKRDNNECQSCPNNEGRTLNVHHIVPLGCGGTNTISNLITLCSRCHGRVHGGNT